MRVLRLTPFFHHDCVTAWPAEFDAVGGMQVQILRLSRELADRGVEQLVMTVGFPGLPRERVDRPGLTVRVTRAPLPRLRSELTGLVGLNQAWLAAVPAACRPLRRTWQPDLVHVHADGQLWALLAGPLVSRILGAPYVITLHCSRLAVYEPMSRFDRLQHRLVTAAERYALRHARRVSVLTARTADTVARLLPLDRALVDVLPDSVGDVRPVPRRRAEEYVRSLGVPAGVPVVGWVGRIAHEKGWRDFVAMAGRWDATVSAAPGAVFLVVGDGPQRERMREAVGAAGLANRFVFTGFLPHDAVPSVMTALDVLVMPSAHEELGGSALEAMVCGTPVAGYAVGGLPDTVGSVTPGLLVPRGDVAALARVAGEAVTEAERHRKTVASAVPDLLSRYGADTVERALAHYRRALGRTSGGGAGCTP
ncbi:MULTISPECIES: glycosyltransferase family 4 protein [unclassified Streptomyces]|uniref:glycosyltransferase family 4 protein n=1 Tax=unclassified Streptomyces TaxID=2593676 RepID=UPI001D15451E|nr:MULTISPECIES: glycosyltransferase family 4 protein [unclassified Streptomyces]MCC3650697.1 glycosyltransferase family 4 protein [Streptomyces sp. S07_1.15]MCC9738430.1 glycosyltransferase family 4 protein [Streptomyces sp. MNU89]